MSGRPSDQEDEEEEVEKVQAYKSWKGVILLYELAQTLSIFHTIMFFAFWYGDLYQYYFIDKEPKTDSNRYMRLIIMWMINTVGPLFMVFDLIFSKIVFRLRHFWVGLLGSAAFLGIQTLGREVMLPNEFPPDLEKLPEMWHRAGAVIGFVVVH